jgi:hypothetical protein
MPARKNKQKSGPSKVKWYFALATEPFFTPSIIQQESIPKSIKIGRYSKQQENFGNRYCEYQNQEGKIVIITEIIDLGITRYGVNSPQGSITRYGVNSPQWGITSNWPDAVCLGPVTKHVRTIYNDSD